jgi:tRNA:m4X modification enzyme
LLLVYAVHFHVVRIFQTDVVLNILDIPLVNSMASNNEATCAYFLLTKKRYCRMTVKAGRKFCGEHASLEAANQACPESAAKYARTPCPYDPNQ